MEKNNSIVKIVSLSAGAIFAIGVVLIAFISGEQNAKNQNAYDEFKDTQPMQVRLEGGLLCNKMDSQLKLSSVNVVYQCEDSGTYLEFVDMQNLEAGQVTTGADSYTVTGGPTIVNIEVIN